MPVLARRVAGAGRVAAGMPAGTARAVAGSGSGNLLGFEGYKGYTPTLLRVFFVPLWRKSGFGDVKEQAVRNDNQIGLYGQDRGSAFTVRHKPVTARNSVR